MMTLFKREAEKEKFYATRRTCMGCGVLLDPPDLKKQTEVGERSDSADECAHCQADYLVRSRAELGELIREAERVMREEQLPTRFEN